VKTAEIPGRSGQGADGPSSIARHGHAASVAKPTPVATMCCSVVPPLGSGDRATAIAQAPPRTRATRPARRTRLSPHAVTKKHAPTTEKAAVINQRSTAPYAANALMVWVSGS
jgi:hypothetical protein